MTALPARSGGFFDAAGILASIINVIASIEALEARDTERAEDLVRQHALGLAEHVDKHADYLD